jgi:hypothetical protein
MPGSTRDTRTFPGWAALWCHASLDLYWPHRRKRDGRRGKGNLGTGAVAMLKCFGEWRLTKLVRGRTPPAITELAAGISVL